MHKIVITITGFIIFAGAIAAGHATYRQYLVKQAALTNKTTVQPTATTTPGPSGHDTFDVEFSKKLLLYNQLATQLADFAKQNAINPAVRQMATQQSSYSTKQADKYAALLKDWGEPFTNIEEFPKTPGGGCSGYPTFPGMLSHADVNEYLKAPAAQIDQQYLALMVRHHQGITTITKAEGSFINYGELITLRDTFYATQDTDLKQMQSLQKQLGYA